MQAAILSIGDELVLGQTVDTNSAYLSGQLTTLGISTLYHQTVADDQAAIVKMIQLACESVELVLISGGLGPTEDDLTRQALAQAMNQELVADDAGVKQIEAYFRKINRPMPERNKIQAMRPAGGQLIENTCGTAPGLQARLGRAMVYVMPGVPREMKAMFELAVLPQLRGQGGQRDVILTKTIHTFGIGESSLAEMLGPTLMNRTRNPKVGTTVSGGVVSVRLRSEFADAAQAAREMQSTRDAVRQALGPVVYGEDHDTLQSATVKLLMDQGVTVASAESCTGGLVSKMITDVAGSSRVYRGGWVTYANDMKIRELGVSAELLNEFGAVSQGVASVMAHAARTQSGAELAVAVTGIAGPEGGSSDKPVGTVWVAMAQASGVAAVCLSLPGDREMVRDRAAKCVLQLLRYALLGVPLEKLSWGRQVTMSQREAMLTNRDMKGVGA